MQIKLLVTSHCGDCVTPKSLRAELATFMTLIIICESEIREINTSLAIQCMQACTRGRFKTINTDFKRINTPFVLSISQRSSEGRIDPPTHPDQIRVGQSTATLSQAVPAWLRPLSNIISHSLFQLSMNRVLWNRLLNTHDDNHAISTKITCKEDKVALSHAV